MKKISQLNLFRALASRNYTLYFIGRAVSQFGTWMQRTAVVWVVYSMTHSAFLLGLTIFAEQFPSFVFSVPGGVAADRYNRYTVIKVTQITSMIQAILLAVLVMSGHIMVWAVLLLSMILGIINAFDVPARQALINDVVASPTDLPNALSLSTATASLAQLLGPALSGIILSAFGAGVCFLLNAASFGAVIISLLLMKLPAYQFKKTNKKVIADFAEGFTYIKNTPGISTIIVMLAAISLLVLPYNTVLPVFAKVVFKGDASTFGYINSFVGIGAVTGTIFLASRKPGAHLKQILFISTLLMGIGLICFSQIRNFPAAMLFAAIAGYGSVAQFTISNIVVQSDAAPQMRGRTMGILLMAIFGMMPLGSVLTGAVSEHIGAPATVLAQGVLAVIIALIFSRFLTSPLKKLSPATESLEKLA
ncbi:MFS transporter [Mucilaginibacter sabulilitoris]|uniref:MFS transporter n=1 Tax=Mucilaginibacter sabulilitoris TaxID=1173583 RepID=A0ABZ0TVG3_9SPHI|nr:MFS transporter [Mucilaginibacter sabulilitoris]WPU97094.1 MFS transporter [Mucilaginibacter sabulilitoris]